MKCVLAAGWAISVLTLSSCVSEPIRPVAPVPPVANAFAEGLEAFRQDRQIPSLSVIVLQDGVPIVEEFLGWSDDEGDVPTSPATSYYIASVTKPISATALMAADAAGEIDLDAKLAESEDWQGFCGWFPTSPIIFSGGEHEGLIVEDFECRGQTLRHALSMRVNGEPGTHFLYNPIVFSRISRFVDETGDRDFRAILYERVLEPAGMKDTAAGWRDEGRGHVLTNVAPPFAVTVDGFAKQPFPDDDFRASAGLYMPARDLARFDTALDAGELIPADLTAEMWSQPLDANGAAAPYAQGWYVQDHQGERLVWHAGWEPDAYSAIYLKLPDRNLTLIALANSEGLHWGNPLNGAEIERSPLVQSFFDAFDIAQGDSAP